MIYLIPPMTQGFDFHVILDSPQITFVEVCFFKI